MQTYKYYENEETLQTLRNMPKIDREKWHTRRVQKEQKAYALFDRMTKATVLFDSSLHDELREVQDEIAQINSMVALRTDPKFQSVLKGFQTTIEQFRKVAAAGKPKLRKYLRQKLELGVILNHLRREEVLVDMLTVYELRIEQICMSHGVNPRPYFQLGRLLEVTRGYATRKLMEEHFGYSR